MCQHSGGLRRRSVGGRPCAGLGAAGCHLVLLGIKSLLRKLLATPPPLTPSLQDKAEQYCENLRLNGLISTIEPAGGGGGSSGGPEAS